MRHLKASFVGLLLGVVLLFTISRLGLSGDTFVNMQGFIYVLGIGAVLAILLVPELGRLPITTLLLATAGIFLFLKLYIYNDPPLFGGIYTYLTLTEAGILGLLVFLAHQVARALRKYMRAVEFVTLANGGARVPQVEEASDLIKAEMNRSRHYNRSLSIILASLQPDDVQLALPRMVAEAQEKVIHHYLTARMAETIRGELRRMDMVLEDPKNNRVVVISPEVDDHGSTILLERLQGAVQKHLGVQMKTGAATYPQVALTFEELVHEAELGMQQNGRLQLEDSTGVAD